MVEQGRLQGQSTAVKVGDAVEVADGPSAGKNGVVIAISGSGQNTRWKCSLLDDDKNIVTWVSGVLLRGDLKQQMTDASVMATAGEKTAGRTDAGFSTTAPRTAQRGGRHWRSRQQGTVKQVSEEERKAMEAKMRAKSSQQAMELAQRKQHYASLSPCDIKDVPWLKAKQMWYIDGGSGGVVLVDLKDKCVALKPQGKSSASEMLAQYLAQVCQIRVAQCRVVRHDELEHQEILKMHVDERSLPIVGADEHLISRFFCRRRNQCGQLAGRGAQLFGVLEYIPGHPLMGLEAQKLLVDPSDSFLESLGRLCALDVLINNMDRIPLPVWSNDGNFGNVMVSAGDIVGIDQQINPICSGPGLQSYLQKVEQLVIAVRGSEVHAGVAKQLNDSLEINTGVRLEHEKLLVVQQGLLSGFETIAKVWRDGDLAGALQAGTEACRDRLSDDSSQWDRIYDEGYVDFMSSFVSKCAERIAGVVDADGCA